jgi:uncharacterized membrane protein
VKKLIFVFSLLIFFALAPRLALAETIHSFDVNVTAQKNGNMNVSETINYDFGDSVRHGIYRYIPLFTKVGNLYRVIKIENISVLRDNSAENFSTTDNAQDLNIKIGNADLTISGSHFYKISYTVKNGIGSNYQDHDEIYWNATGNGWQVPIEKVSTKITTDFNAVQNNLICFTGVSGSKDENCTAENGQILTTQELNPGEGLTVVAGYPVGTFPKSVLVNQAPKTFSETIMGLLMANYYLIYAFLNLVLPILLIYWYLKHKNKQAFGKPTVNFDIPKDENKEVLRPALAGTIDTAKLEKDDVVATIFDLAIRKYIKMEEVDKKEKILGMIGNTKKDQKIIRLKAKNDDLNEYEKNFMDNLFDSSNSVMVSDLKLGFYDTFSQMETDVFSALVKKGYYSKNPKNQKGILLFLGVMSMVFILNIPLGLTLLFLSLKLNGRTPTGDEIDYKIDGLKLFLKAMDRNYQWQAEQLYIVEQMIPYAIALGYIDKFMEQLKIIKPDYNPSWYSGYNGNFYLGYAALYSSMNSNVITTAPSSSSGFGGGGFSGGGGGGGGGGSW